MDVFMLPINIRNIREAVTRTMIFFDIFDFPLTLDEISHYLLGLKVDRPHLKLYLEQSNSVGHHHGYYFLKNRAELVEYRNMNLSVVNNLWKRVYKFLGLFSAIPFIKMIAICNTLAYNNPTSESDIDLFVVTKKDRLFTARAILSILTHLLRIRRHGKKIAGRFCLSFFAAENVMNLEGLCLKPYDIYAAYWTMSLAPVYGSETYAKFVAENTWTRRYFPDGIVPRTEFLMQQGMISRLIKYLFEKILGGNFGDKIERFLGKHMIDRAERKAAKLPDRRGTIISKDMLKFHDHDIREIIREMWEARIRKFS
ncbi:hypothetical protein HZA39_02260 [Candidatus Peregrinibacteria bacterium]|nr:hypothetical protein [Candidatus Peregrinibacteria bacterium]